MAKSKKKRSNNGKNGKNEPDSGLWPILGAAIILVLIIAAILLLSNQDTGMPAEASEAEVLQAFRDRGVSEIIIQDLARDFASGDYTLKELKTNYPGFEEDIDAVHDQLAVVEDEVIATVNGDPITQNELATQIALLPEPYQQLFTEEQVLQEIIDERLLMQEGARQGIVVSDEDVDAAYQELLVQSQLTEEQLLANLQSFGLDNDDLKNMLHRQLMISRVLNTSVNVNLSVSEEEVKRFYADNEAAFQADAQVTVKHILFATSEEISAEDAQAAAEDALARYDDSEDFCDLVAELTADVGSRENCGEYTFGRGFMVPEFEEVSFRLAAEETEIVLTQFGAHLVLKIEDLDATTTPYEDVRDEIEARLISQQRTERYQAYIQELRENAEIIFAGEEPEESTGTSVEIVPPEDTEPVEPEEPVTEVEEPTPEESAPEVEVEDLEVIVPETPSEPVEPIEVSVTTGDAETEEVDDLAGCLADKDVTLYMAAWATASVDEAEAYAGMVTVLDCAGDDEATCLEADVNAYPSWNVEGEQHWGRLSEQELAAMAGC